MKRRAAAKKTTTPARKGASARSRKPVGKRGSRPRGKGRARRPQPIEYSLLLTATMCLLAFGAVMVFSASSTTSLLGESGDGAYFLKRTLLFGALGLVAMRLLAVNGTRILRPLAGPLLVVSLGLLVAVHLPGIGLSANGAQRWIGAGLIQIQPSEIAKLALVLYGAHLLATRPQMVAHPRLLVPYLAPVGLAALLIVTEPDLGTALVLATSAAVLLFAAGAQVRHLAAIGGTIAVFALLAIAIEPYRMERLTGFLDPSADPGGAGFQGIQASIALGSGGLFGVGLGESVQKAFYLPEAHTDMIAAVIGEELGLVGISLLVSLFVLFGYAGLRTAQRCRDRFGKLLAAGLTATILAQASLNLFAVLGLAPLTGVPLPFVSYGNSSLLVTLAGVGLLLNIASGRAARAGRLRVIAGEGHSRASAPAGRSSASATKSATKGRHSGGRYGGTRRAGAGRRRRAAG